MSRYMSPYMLSEYLDIHEVASLSVKGEVVSWKEYNSNNDIIQLERKLLKSIVNGDIHAKKYLFYNLIAHVHDMLTRLPNSFRIRMRPADVTELYKKWGYTDVCFNPETTQKESESAPVPSKIPWAAPDNAFAELVSVLWKQGYIGADSVSDALKKTAPHFTVNSDSEILRKGLELKRIGGTSNFDLIPKAGDFEEGKNCFSGIKPARQRRKKSTQKRINKGDDSIPE